MNSVEISMIVMPVIVVAYYMIKQANILATRKRELIEEIEEDRDKKLTEFVISLTSNDYKDFIRGLNQEKLWQLEKQIGSFRTRRLRTRITEALYKLDNLD